jgi:hypothetical protein
MCILCGPELEIELIGKVSIDAQGAETNGKNTVGMKQVRRILFLCVVHRPDRRGDLQQLIISGDCSAQTKPVQPRNIASNSKRHYQAVREGEGGLGIW